MLKKIVFGWFVILLSTFLLIGEATAKPTVRLMIIPNVRELSIGQGRQSITITAEVGAGNLQFTWTLQGPGQLIGEPTGPGRMYILPEQIEQPRTQVVITVTVTDANGEQASAQAIFTLLAPVVPTPLPATPTPQPATPTPRQTAMLTVRSNVSGDMVLIDGKQYGATRLDQELPVGKHVIRVEKAGCAPYEETVELQAALTIRAVLACPTWNTAVWDQTQWQ